ncbi:MAG: SDR family oxidoreductase [Acidobacteriota bacterium]
MKCFVTGATGFIGSALAIKLAESGHTVHALYRSKLKTVSLRHPNIRLFKGNILDLISIHKAMESCSYVFHTAAMTKIWTKNPELYHDINVTGTKNILKTALTLGVKKVVMTSTAGVFGPSQSCEVSEKTIRKTECFTEYEKTKEEADSLALDFFEKGLDVVLVYPTRVYGPGFIKESNSAAKVMKLYIKGRWPIIPGSGKSIGNYVYIDDVVKGHILAIEKGKPGERYILGGENVSYQGFFNSLKKVSQKNYPLLRIPFFFIMALSQTLKILTKIFNFYPFITPEMAKKLNQNWPVSNEKALQNLGYIPTPLEEGMKKTIQWFEREENDK